jgi:membrane protein implicated in regulation of membrane protease activity
MHHSLLLLPLLALLLFLILPWPLALLVYLPISAVAVVGFWKARQALHRPPSTGAEAMIGKQAVVLHTYSGRLEVQCEGEIWRAVAPHPLHKGQKVVVEAVEGLTLKVAPVPEPVNHDGSRRNGRRARNGTP